LNREEIRIVRKERRIQVALDGGEIDPVVLGSGMVSGNEQAESGENR
jgi:hypothetical protein